ncbi:MAG: glycosyltransferase [Acidimicrobiia bacterium]|nr:glycosyltransferase [Acidimicrobiia bacterium]
MRVVQVVSDSDRRGAQVFATELGRVLIDQGFDVSTVALVPGRSDATIDVASLTASSHWIRGLPALRRRTSDVDLVVAHGSTSLPAAVLAAGAPFVYRSIGDLPQWVTGGARRAWVGWMLRRARGVTVLWPELVPFVTHELGVDADRVAVIPNAVDVSRCAVRSADEAAAARQQLDVDPSRPVVAHVGALAPEKRVAQLVDAAADAGVQLLLAGDGPERAELERRAHERGLTARFLGSVADPGPVYAAADVVALASSTEGQPAVLIEAALSGRAVVAPRVGGVPGVVTDGVTGVLYAGGRAALAEALGRAVDHSEALGAAARAPALARFDVEVVGRQWAMWLEQLQVAQAK